MAGAVYLQLQERSTVSNCCCCCCKMGTAETRAILSLSCCCWWYRATLRRRILRVVESKLIYSQSRKSFFETKGEKIFFASGVLVLGIFLGSRVFFASFQL